MFNRKQYRDVAAAYIAGLSDLTAERGRSLEGLLRRLLLRLARRHSRRQASRRKDREGRGAKSPLTPLKGKPPLANAKLVYQDYLSIFGGAGIRALRAKGARVQRPLWASTGTKNRPTAIFSTSKTSSDPTP